MNSSVENRYIGSKDLELSKPSVMTKLYVWSIIIEPLLFFIVLTPDIIGITANVSKLLQFTVFIYFIVKLLIPNNSVIVTSPFSSIYINYTYYFIWTVIAGLFGLVVGAYNIENDVSTAAAGIREYYRPIMEYIIAAYYFLYFMVLPRYFLNNARSINYFFKAFTIVFFVSLFIGYSDLILFYLITGYEGIPRHLSDMTLPGARFHGIAGEPRDAIVYLMFGLCMIALQGIWENTKKPNKLLVTIVIIAAILTQSFSGLFGIVFFCGLYIMFGSNILTNYRSYIYLIIIICFVAISINYSDRVILYFDAINEFFLVTRDIENVHSILSVSLNNVNPFWVRIQEVKDYNLLPSIIGTGLGSTSIANSNLFNVFEVINPNANIIRSFFESGIVGLFIFILAFITPLKRINASKKELYILVVAMLLMIGMYFGHRSPELFIFFGIVMAVYKVKSLSKQINI